MNTALKNILVSCLSVVLFSATAQLVCGCKPESKETPESPEPGPDPVPDPGKLASVSTMEIGDTFVIPFTGELHLPYSGIKQGDEIVLTTRADKSVKYTLYVHRQVTLKGLHSLFPSISSELCVLSMLLENQLIHS